MIVSKIPVKPIIDLAKIALPKAKDIIIKDPEKTIVVVEKVAAASTKFVSKVNDYKEKRNGEQSSKRKIHYRKLKHSDYHKDILPKLDSFNHIQLIGYKQEVENFINQIKNAQENEIIISKPLHLKRIKSWNEILIQIEDKIKSKNYSELLKMHNDNGHNSNYFGSKIKDYLSEIEQKDDLYQFIIDYTSRDINEIKKDFI